MGERRINDVGIGRVIVWTVGNYLTRLLKEICRTRTINGVQAIYSDMATEGGLSPLIDEVMETFVWS